MTFELPEENKMAGKKIDDLATKEDLANHVKAFKYHFIIWQLILFVAFNVFLIMFLKFYLKAF